VTQSTAAHAVPLVRIHADDNVLVLTQTVKPGDTLDVEGRAVKAEAALGLGHKIAARDIAQGERILKYGLPIGTATEAIAAGAHVHVHNMQSDYLPTYTHEAGHRYGKDGAAN
jgi:hypothetical protein